MTAIITLPRWMQPRPKKVYVTRSGGKYMPEDVALSMALVLRFHDSADELRALARRLIDKVCLEHQPNMKRLAREPDDETVFVRSLVIINRVCDMMKYAPEHTFRRNPPTMKALSIKQPWAWLIVHGGKDVENRTWHTKYRGRFLVHASKGMTLEEYGHAKAYAEARGVVLPEHYELQRGGIVGSVELVDSVEASDSPWFMGKKAFTLRNPQALEFTPYRGRLQFFDVEGVYDDPVAP
jgi:hypothetical protein